MMENPAPAIEEAVGAVLCDCVACISIPVKTLQLEIDVPIGGWDGLFEQMNIKPVTDHIGRKAITAPDARRLLTARRREAELTRESHERLAAERDQNQIRPGGGLPVLEGASPVESLYAAAKVVTVEEEFGGRPKPRFLIEEIEAGARQRAEEKREAEAKAKQRLADQLKRDLRGRP